MDKDKSSMDIQLEARGEWAKFQVTGDSEAGEIALTLAQQSGYGGDEKSALIKNTPELSKAFDEGVKESATDWAIERKMSNEPEWEYFQKFGPAIPPTVGTSYEGPIVHGDSERLYQAAKVHGNEVLVMHNRTELSSVQTNTLAGGDKSVNIRYVAEGVGIAKPVKELDGPRTPEYQPKSGPGAGRG